MNVWAFANIHFMTAFDLFWNFAICSQSKLVEAPHCTIFKEPKLFRTFTVTSENHLRRWILTCNHRHFGIYMPKHLAEQWLLVRSNSFRLPGSGEVPGVVRGRWEVGYVGLPATGKLRVDGGSGISRDCRAESVGFNVGGIDQSNFDPERGTVKGISKAVILMPEVSGIEVVPDPFSEAGRELFFLAVNFQPDLQVVIFLEKKGPPGCRGDFH